VSDDLYTKKGRRLTVSLGGDVFDARSGRRMGRRRGDRIYGPNGQYAGTIFGRTVVYRRPDSVGRRGSLVPTQRLGSRSVIAKRMGRVIPGEEPFQDV